MLMKININIFQFPTNCLLFVCSWHTYKCQVHCMFNLPVIVINYGKSLAQLNICKSLIAITLNGIICVGWVVENQKQCLISIVVIRLYCQLSMILLSNCNYSELHATCWKFCLRHLCLNKNDYSIYELLI